MAKSSFLIKSATETEAGKIFKEIDASKMYGIDGIPPRVLKWADLLLIPILTKIFNHCVEAGIYPESLKVARVRFVFLIPYNFLN